VIAAGHLLSAGSCAGGNRWCRAGWKVLSSSSEEEAGVVAVAVGVSLGEESASLVARGVWMPLVWPLVGLTAAAEAEAEAVGVMGEELERCVVGSVGVVDRGVAGAEIGVECCGRAFASFCG